MKFNTEAWAARKHQNFKSDLIDYLIAKDVGIHKDRTQNQIVWWNIKPDDPIIASAVRYWISKVNIELKTRNEALNKNSQYSESDLIESTDIVYNKTALGTPYQEVQLILRKFLGDNIQGNLPSELKSLKSPDTKTLIISKRDKFVRLPFNHTEDSGNDFTIKYNQLFRYFGDSRGTSQQQTTYSDLKDLETYIKNTGNKVNVGILQQGSIEWFNNIYVKSLELKEIPINPETALGKRPDNWIENIGEDTASLDIQNLFELLGYDKSKTIFEEPNKTIVEEHLKTLDQKEKYLENIEWQHTQRNIQVTVVLSYDKDLETLIQSNLNQAVITAEQLNQFKAYTNKLTSQCICNCNYCTCDCNYCTCDCNYCTCNCNYCTCNCNYCTCNCNYKYLEPTDVSTKVTDYDYYTQYFCSCNVNKGQYYTYNYWGAASLQTPCPSNTEYYKYCSCNTNSGQQELRNYLFSIAKIVESCLCNTNTKVLDFKTSYFKNLQKFENINNSDQPNTVPLFSKAESYQDETIENGKEITEYTVCVCNINKKLKTVTKSFTDHSLLIKEIQNNKNIDGTAKIQYILNNTTPYEYPSVKDTKAFYVVDCDANSELATKLDFKKFWEDTIYKAGKATISEDS